MMRPPAAYFLASAAAHAAVFASLSGPGSLNPTERPRPLEVRLALAPAAQPTLPAALPASPVHRERRPAMPASHALTIDATRPAVPPLPAPPKDAGRRDETAAPAELPAPTAEQDAPAAPIAAAAPLTERIALQRPVVPIAVTDTSRYPDPTLVAGYARTLSDGVARLRRYPALARMRGWQGTAVVNVTIGQNGELLDLKVNRSSGHDILDQQALTMIREALPLPPPPEALRGLALVVQLPVTFTLSP